MTVSSDLNKHVYEGNGVTTTWPFTFALLAAADLKVYLTNPTTGEETLLSSNYKIEPTESAYPCTSGNVIYPGWETGTEPPVELRPPTLPDNWKITLLRDLEILQETVYPSNSSYPPKTVERSFDRQTMIMQQFNERLDRAFTAGVSTETAYTLPAPSAGAGLIWDASGNLVNGTPVDPLLSMSDLQGAIDHSNGVGTPHTAIGVGALPVTGGTITGALIEAVGANIASAATLDLSAATGNLVHVTGTTGVTALTMTAGQRIEVIFDGVLTLTHHATNNNLPGGKNITTAAGDSATYYYDGTTVKCTKYQRANGKAVDSLLVSETVLTENQTSVTFSDLGGLAAKGYILDVALVTNGSGSQAIKMYANGDTTDADYMSNLVVSASGTISSANYNYPWAGGANASGGKLVYGVLYVDLVGASPNYKVAYNFNIIDESGYGYNGGGMKITGTVSDLTSLTLTTSLADGLGIGSKFRLYRRY